VKPSEIAERIREAGFKYDGHVTNGSHAELMKVIEQAVRDEREAIAQFIEDRYEMDWEDFPPAIRAHGEKEK
jgi:hypothetical protein